MYKWNEKKYLIRPIISFGYPYSGLWDLKSANSISRHILILTNKANMVSVDIIAVCIVSTVSSPRSTMHAFTCFISGQTCCILLWDWSYIYIHTFVVFFLLCLVYLGFCFIIIYSLEFFTSALANGLSLEFQWQQVSSSFQDSSQYSGRSQ